MRSEVADKLESVHKAACSDWFTFDEVADMVFCELSRDELRFLFKELLADGCFHLRDVVEFLRGENDAS